MKTKKLKLVNAVLSVTMALATFSGAMANDEQYLNSDPIDINGYVKQEAPVTDHELENVKNELRKQKNAITINKEKSKKYKQLSRSTEKLADATEEMIEERAESQQTIDAYNKKIDCLMDPSKDGCDEYRKDEVKVVQAAPVVEKAVEAPRPTNDVFGSEVKVLPYSGLTTIMSENERLEASISAGIKVETNVNERVSVGMGFNYQSLTTKDYGNTTFDNGLYGQYSSVYGGREIEYKNMNFDLYSKFYIIKNNRFRPYVGAGLGYNRSTMKYTNNQNFSGYYNGNPYAFGNEEIIASSINAELMAGSEVTFSDSIGMILELNYTRGIGGNLSSEKGLSQSFAYDQQRLEDLATEISEANIISLYSGLMVTF